MKFVVENMIRLLVTVVAVALVLTSVSKLLLPAVREFIPTSFSHEENYDSSEQGSGPKINCVSEVIIPLNGTVDIFSNITVESSSGENLISQLTDDYSKTNFHERENVFVYKINKDNSNTLCERIITTEPGKWVVVYLVADESGTNTAKISYVVRDV